MKDNNYQPWPALSYEEFKPNSYLLHMAIQAIGKLKLMGGPYDPQWASVALWLTSRGLTTGQILHGIGTFTVDIDFTDHEIICSTSWALKEKFKIRPMSVADLISKLLSTLAKIGVDVTINPQPAEKPDALPFDQDISLREYDENIINAWWRIMVSTYRVLRRYHVQFIGRTPPIGLMWGSMDLRDARYKGSALQSSAHHSGYIRRKTIEDSQIEVGLWCGNASFPHIAYYSFIYPQPLDIERTKIYPDSAYWNEALGEFILTYDNLRKSKNPEEELLLFFESTYQVSAELAGWEPGLIVARSTI